MRTGHGHVIPAPISWWLWAVLAFAAAGLLLMAVGLVVALAHKQLGRDSDAAFEPWMVAALLVMCVPWVPAAGLIWGVFFGLGKLLAGHMREKATPPLPSKRP
jgi:hypothetical protein